MVRTGQSLIVGNKDSVGHNTKIDSFANSSINVLVPSRAAVEQRFPAAERGPVPVGCNIHTWMQAHLLVKDHPYAAISAADGSFRLENLPHGEWTFQFWHETAGYVDVVRRDGQPVQWSKGRVNIKVDASKTDLGDLGLNAELFEE